MSQPRPSMSPPLSPTGGPNLSVLFLDVASAQRYLPANTTLTLGSLMGINQLVDELLTAILPLAPLPLTQSTLVKAITVALGPQDIALSLVQPLKAPKIRLRDQAQCYRSDGADKADARSPPHLPFIYAIARREAQSGGGLTVLLDSTAPEARKMGTLAVMHMDIALTNYVWRILDAMLALLPAHSGSTWVLGERELLAACFRDPQLGTMYRSSPGLYRVQETLGPPPPLLTSDEGHPSASGSDAGSSGPSTPVGGALWMPTPCLPHGEGEDRPLFRGGLFPRRRSSTPSRPSGLARGLEAVKGWIQRRPSNRAESRLHMASPEGRLRDHDSHRRDSEAWARPPSASHDTAAANKRASLPALYLTPATHCSSHPE